MQGIEHVCVISAITMYMELIAESAEANQGKEGASIEGSTRKSLSKSQLEQQKERSMGRRRAKHVRLTVKPLVTVQLGSLAIVTLRSRTSTS